MWNAQDRATTTLLGCDRAGLMDGLGGSRDGGMSNGSARQPPPACRCHTTARTIDKVDIAPAPLGGSARFCQVASSRTARRETMCSGGHLVAHTDTLPPTSPAGSRGGGTPTLTMPSLVDRLPLLA